MSALSDYMENQMMKWALSAQAVTRPTAWYVALFSAAPGDAGGGTEIVGGSYARQAATWNIVNNQGSNIAELAYASTADWPPITHVGVFDALTGGNLMWHGALGAPRDPSSGDTIRFAAGQLVLELD